MTDEDIDTDEDEEEEEEDAGSPYRVMIPIGVVLCILGLLLFIFAVLAGFAVGPMPGLLETLSGLIGFFSVDMMYILGMAGISLFLAGLVTMFQGIQEVIKAGENNDQPG